MRDKGYGVVANWNYVTISLIVVVVLTILVLYMPGIREFDRGMLNGIRHFLAPYPSYIPAFVAEFGRANYMLWPQIAACSVLVSHGKYLKAFLLVFFTICCILSNSIAERFCLPRKTRDLQLSRMELSIKPCMYNNVFLWNLYLLNYALYKK